MALLAFLLEDRRDILRKGDGCLSLNPDRQGDGCRKEY
jgi:hypothetical protein